MIYLLDTSALLAFLLNEREADRVESLIFTRSGSPTCAVSFASWIEIHGRLRFLGIPQEEIRDQLTDARALPLETLWPDESIMEVMMSLKSRRFFPFADALIAATARANDLTLLHKDEHFAALPADIKQINLDGPWRR